MTEEPIKVDYGPISQKPTCSTQSGYYGVVCLYSGLDAEEDDFGCGDEPYLTARVTDNQTSTVNIP